MGVPHPPLQACDHPTMVRAARSTPASSAPGRLTGEQKWAIIHEWKRVGNIRAMARDPSFPHGIKAIKYWVGKFKRCGTVDVPSAAGRPRRLDVPASRRAVDLLQDFERYGSAERVAEQLHKEGLTPGTKPADKSTLIRAAVAQSKADGDELQLASGPPKKELTADTKAKRLAFARANLHTNWAHVLFTDRKKFAFKYPGSKHVAYRWFLKSNGGKQGKKYFMPNNPQRVNIYMGISKWGVTKVHKVAGSKGYKSPFTNKKGEAARNITANEYEHVLRQTLLPEGSRLFRQRGLSGFKLQQDNDPSHKKPAAKQLAEWNKQHPGRRVALLRDWPPNSPDLSPIENVWGIVQREVDAVGCSSFAEFEALVVRKLQRFSLSRLQSLYNSMSKRMALVIAAGGDKINY